LFSQLDANIFGAFSGASALDCTDATVTISAAADVTSAAACATITGSVEIVAGAGSSIDLSGELTKIGGSLTASNLGDLVSFSSTSLKSIGGAFILHNDTFMSTLKFTNLSSVGSIDWATLSNLGSFTYGDGNGITSGKSVAVADTFMNTLEGINIDALDTLDINNNHHLTSFTSKLKSLSTLMNINANGNDLEVSLPNLVWAANLTISNVTSFSAPSLATINGSIRFDSDYMETFSAPNLTEVQSGDLSFVSNSKVTNISCPLLTRVGGGFTIANNTAMEELNGFPLLNEVGGAIKLRGSFSSVDLGSLNDVKGAFDLSSTSDISSSCTSFQTLKNSGDIQGAYSCTSNNANANNDVSSAGGSSSSSSGTNNTSSGVITTGHSMSWLVSLVSIAGFVVTFL
jgi:hypothetical protein